jgi:hypothetical protein
LEEAEGRARGICVWLPMMPGDDEGSARAEVEAFGSDTASHFWDEGREAGELFRQALGLRSVAWDVYLLYGPGVRWGKDAPPTPSFWMHQLPAETGVDQGQRLDAARLAEEMSRLLESGESDRNRGLRLHAQGLDWLTRQR